MFRNRTAWVAVACLALLVAAAGIAFAGDTMKYFAAEFALPTDTQPRDVPKLVYRTEKWVAGVVAVRLEELPGADAKEATWWLSTTNTRPSHQLIEVDVFLLGENGARLANGHLMVALPNAEKSEQKVKMKLPAGSWSNARGVRVEVKFKAR